jgi:hypothetical protein
MHVHPVHPPLGTPLAVGHVIWVKNVKKLTDRKKKMRKERKKIKGETEVRIVYKCRSSKNKGSRANEE